MKIIIRKFLAGLMVVVILLCAFSTPAMALTKQEQEDFYRVNTWWQDEYNQQYIGWLLESDNFMYHLDISTGNIIHDMSYSSLNLNPKQRKDNFVEILTSFIGLSYDEIREQSAAEAFSDISVEFLDGLKDFLEDAQLYTVDQFKYMESAINETSYYYLNYYYGIDTNMGKYGYQDIYERIQSAFDNKVQNFDWPDNKSKVMQEFYNFTNSSEWHEKLSDVSDVFSIVSDSVELGKEGIALIGELESYNRTDEKLVELLKYIKAKSTDSALRAACDEIIAKFENSYTLSIAQGILQIAGDKTLEWTFDNVKDLISDQCGIYAIFAKMGIVAGKTVSDLWFNTKETKQQMQTIYCLNHISELLVPMLEKELNELYSYNESSTFRSAYAADAIYHMSVLIELRKKGEEAYYKLKDSVYGSNIIKACKNLDWGKFKDDEQIIEAWYSEFTSVINAVQASLYKMLPTNYYYKRPVPAEFEHEGDRLVSYNGNSVNVNIPATTKYSIIDSYAFNRNEIIESANIPCTITTINANAFYNCTNLKSVTINHTETIIAEGSFVNCHKDFTIYGYSNSTAQTYAVANGIKFVPLNSEYENAQNYVDKDFVIEDGVLVEYCGGGGDVYIPYGVTKIGPSVFSGYANHRNNLNNVYIPETVLSIDGYAFGYCNIYTLVLYDTIQINSFAFDDAFIDRLCFADGTSEITCSMIPQTYNINTLILPSSVEKIDPNFTARRHSSSGSYSINKNIQVAEDNCYYSSKDGVLYNKEQTSLLICPAERETVCEIPETVTKIEEYAFFDCQISMLEIPNNVTEIMLNAFISSHISELIYNANIPLEFFGNIDGWSTVGSGKTPFEYSTIDALKIGSSAKVVPNFLFEGVSIKSIDLGNNVEIIGDRAFAYCSVEDISIPKGVTYLGAYAFYSSKIKNFKYNVISAKTESLPFAFSEFEQVEFGANVTNIPNSLFEGCELPSKIEIPNTVISIGDSAFAGCVTLSEITIPNTVISIGNYAFADCTSLKSLTIPENVATIGNGIISGCENIKKVIYEAKNAVGSYSFQSDHVTELEIGENVESLDYYTFSGMTGLKTVIWNAVDAGEGPFFDISSDDMSVQKIVIGEKVEQLPHDPFYTSSNAFTSVTEIEFNAVNCQEWGWDEISYLPNLKKITIGNKVIALPDGFLCYAAVETVTIPENVSSIGMHGLSKCENLREVTILNKDFDISWGCFEDCPNLTIYSFASNTYLMHKCEELQIPFVAFCEHPNLKTDIVREPSCTETGIVKYVCSDCGYSYEENLSIKHNYANEWTIDILATCTTVGSKSRHCLECDAKTDIIEIPVYHTYKAVTVEPTCTQDGSITYTCEICSDMYVEVLLATHLWSSVWTVDVEPTETTEGSKSRHCIRCDAKTDVTVIPMLSTESPTTDFEYSIQNGEVRITGYVGTSGRMNIPTYIEGCPVTTIAAFAFSGNTTITEATIPYTVTAMEYYAFYGCSKLLEITIGSGITELPQAAFSNCSSLTSVVIPETVFSIGDSTFHNCESLVSVVLGKNVKSIEERAFYSCVALKEINIPDVTSYVGADAFYDTPWFDGLSGDCLIMGNNILMKYQNEFGDDIKIPEGVQSIYGDFTGGAFKESYVGTVYIPSTLTNWIQGVLRLDARCFVVDANNTNMCAVDGVLYSLDMTRLKAVPSKKTGSIILPETVRYIEDYAFESSSIDKVVLNAGLLEIGEYAFYWCVGLTSITIPNSVTSIGEHAFSSCDGITSIIIPSSVTSIGEYAFSFCENLANVIILGGITNIEMYMFYDCNNLSSITLSDTIISIDSGAFRDCNSLTQVWYAGSEEDMANIDIDRYNECLTNATWCYNSCIGSQEHTYDDSSDTICNECGAERDVVIMLGDVSGDGEINNRDLAQLMQFINGWSNEINEQLSDVNDDGRVNNKDYALLMRYINGWEVQLI